MSEKELLQENNDDLKNVKDSEDNDGEDIPVSSVDDNDAENSDDSTLENNDVHADETDEETMVVKVSEYEQLKKEKSENYDKMLRAIAELENFRKRSQREREQYLKYSNENIIKEIVVIYENMSRALEHSRKEKGDTNIDKIIEGINMILEMISNLLKKNGVEEIEAEGLHFDPKCHEAVQMVETDAEDDIVVQVLQNGYKMFDKIIKPCMVVVNKKKS